MKVFFAFSNARTFPKILAPEIIAALLIVLFVYAGGTKLLDHERFVAQLGQSPLLTPFAGMVAWGVPGIEIITALMLSLRRFRLMGWYLSFGLMVLFTSYIFVILNFSEHIPCSCGGILEKMGWSEHLVFNSVFTFLALAGILLHKNQSAYQ